MKQKISLQRFLLSFLFPMMLTFFGCNAEDETTLFEEKNEDHILCDNPVPVFFYTKDIDLSTSNSLYYQGHISWQEKKFQIIISPSPDDYISKGNGFISRILEFEYMNEEKNTYYDIFLDGFNIHEEDWPEFHSEWFDFYYCFYQNSHTINVTIPENKSHNTKHFVITLGEYPFFSDITILQDPIVEEHP